MLATTRNPSVGRPTARVETPTRWLHARDTERNRHRVDENWLKRPREGFVLATGAEARVHPLPLVLC